MFLLVLLFSLRLRFNSVEPQSCQITDSGANRFVQHKRKSFILNKFRPCQLQLLQGPAQVSTHLDARTQPSQFLGRSRTLSNTAIAWRRPTCTCLLLIGWTGLSFVPGGKIYILLSSPVFPPCFVQLEPQNLASSSSIASEAPRAHDQPLLLQIFRSNNI